MTAVVFWVFAAAAVLGATLCVLNRNPVASAMWLMSTMFSLAAIFFLLGAELIGILQILVYVGAIMVVFLFVIMLLNLGEGEVNDTRGLGWKLTAAAVGVALLAQIFALTKAQTVATLTLPEGYTAAQVNATGAIAPIAQPLFTQYLLAFEVTSILLLAAIVGAVVLGKQRGHAEGEHAR
jgi:NADH-quinone oxidoreductase subunit J